VSRPARPDAREALLEAARAEFARRGLEGARVEDVARRAGMSKGAFYLHFRTKEEAFGALLQRLLGALEEHARRRHDAEEGFCGTWRPEGPEALARRMEFDLRLDLELLETVWRNRQLLAALDTAGGSVANARLVADFRRRMRTLVAGRLRDQQRAGGLRADVDADALGDMVVGSYEAFARRMVDLPARPDLEAWARSFLRVFYEGLLDPSALAPPTPPRPRRRRAAGR
jgi:AcrR family transcriptional regulator